MFDVGETKTSYCEDDSLWGLYPGYPINRVTESPALKPVSDTGSCQFTLVRNVDDIDVSEMQKFSFENCSIYLAGYPKVEGGLISLELSKDSQIDALKRPSPASDCFFRLTMMLQGFDRALFVPKSDMFDDVGNVSPFETLYNSRSKEIPRVFEFLKFFCEGITKHYYSENLKPEIDKCIAKVRERGVSSDMEIG